MSTILGAVRRQLLTPPLHEVLFETRGFRAHDPHAQQLLEMSGRQFVIGFGFAMESRETAECVTRLETLAREFRGFAYEGAAMALALRDALRPAPRGRRTEDFLAAGRGASHIYMAYLGIGFALARLPRLLWRRALPDVSRLPDHPSLSWFIWDGYGFHQAFFNPSKWIEQQHVSNRYPWPVHYVNRVVDHGIGRALWFYHGAHPHAVAKAVEAFGPARWADLWSGVGVASCYAGGVDREGLVALKRLAGPYHDELFLGAVLALKARVLADTVNDHSHLAADVVCRMSAADAADITNQVVVDLPLDSQDSSYETFRGRIRRHSPHRTRSSVAGRAG